MQAILVPVAAEILIIKTLRAKAANPAAPVTDIALFAHAFDPGQLIFGSARVAGALMALPPALMVALRPLVLAAARAQSLRAQIAPAAVMASPRLGLPLV